MEHTASLYNKDFYAWTVEQAQLIKNKAFDKLDLTHLIEEVTSMGAREKSELKNRLALLLMHLLKWKFQPARRSRSWQNTIYDQREELTDLLEDNPSLKARLNETLIKAYQKAVREAVNETGLDEKSFPATCEWTLTQIMTEEFLPS